MTHITQYGNDRIKIAIPEGITVLSSDTTHFIVEFARKISQSTTWKHYKKCKEWREDGYNTYRAFTGSAFCGCAREARNNVIATVVETFRSAERELAIDRPKEGPVVSATETLWDAIKEVRKLTTETATKTEEAVAGLVQELAERKTEINAIKADFVVERTQLTQNVTDYREAAVALGRQVALLKGIATPQTEAEFLLLADRDIHYAGGPVHDS